MKEVTLTPSSEVIEAIKPINITIKPKLNTSTAHQPSENLTLNVPLPPSKYTTLQLANQTKVDIRPITNATVTDHGNHQFIKNNLFFLLPGDRQV